MIRHRDSPDQTLKFDDRLGIHHFFQFGFFFSGYVAHDVELLALAGILDIDVKQEAVELSFGQGVGSFLLDRVLSSQNEKGFVQLEILSAR